MLSSGKARAIPYALTLATIGIFLAFDTLDDQRRWIGHARKQMKRMNQALLASLIGAAAAAKRTWNLPGTYSHGRRKSTRALLE